MDLLYPRNWTSTAVSFGTTYTWSPQRLRTLYRLQAMLTVPNDPRAFGDRGYRSLLLTQGRRNASADIITQAEHNPRPGMPWRDTARGEGFAPLLLAYRGRGQMEDSQGERGTTCSLVVRGFWPVCHGSGWRPLGLRTRHTEGNGQPDLTVLRYLRAGPRGCQWSPPRELMLAVG